MKLSDYKIGVPYWHDWDKEKGKNFMVILRPEEGVVLEHNPRINSLAIHKMRNYNGELDKDTWELVETDKEYMFDCIFNLELSDHENLL